MGFDKNILTKVKRKEKEIFVEEFKQDGFDGKITIKEMTALESEKLEQTLTDAKGTLNMENVRAKYIIACCYVGDEKMFEPSDLKLVSSLPSSVSNKIFKEISSLAEVTESDFKKMVKN